MRDKGHIKKIAYHPKNKDLCQKIYLYHKDKQVMSKDSVISKDMLLIF